MANIALGNGSVTGPSTSIASFLATGGDRLLVRSLLGLPRHGGPRPARRGTVMRAPRWAGARTASVSGGDHDGQALARGVVGGEDPRPFGGGGGGVVAGGRRAAARGAPGPPARSTAPRPGRAGCPPRCRGRRPRPGGAAAAPAGPAPWPGGR